MTPAPPADGAALDVLIATCDRPAALAVTLIGLLSQDLRGLRVVVSDQSLPPAVPFETAEVTAAVRALRRRGTEVELHRHLPRRGMAEQRAFLLGRSHRRYCVFLDDDVLLEPGVLARLLEAIERLGCGLVGAAVQGMSFLDDERPQEQAVEWWGGHVVPERVRKGLPGWERWRLHNAANITHVERGLRLAPGQWRAYKIAWVGGCALFDAEALRATGGFDFWRDLPPRHRGEDVVAQLRVLEHAGGAGVVPSGAYHLELPTTLPRDGADAYALVLEAADPDVHA